MKRLARKFALVLVAALAALFALDLRRSPGDPTPKLLSRVEGHGQLLAGAGQAEIQVPYPVVPAGYGPRDRHEVMSAAQPQMARAIALQVGEAKLTLVSVDLLEIDSKLMSELMPRLPKDVGEVWVCATHTHTGMGNYDPNLLAEIAGTGKFKKEAREALLTSIHDTVLWALVHLQDAKATINQRDLSKLALDRSDSADAPDPIATTVEFETEDHFHPIRLLSFAAHPTTVDRDPRQLNSDFPGEAIRFDSIRKGMTGFFQGAGGNVSVPHDMTTQAVPDFSKPHDEHEQSLGEQVANGGTVIRRESMSMDDARVIDVAVNLPEASIHSGPPWTRRAASNLVDRIAAPREATLSVARLGPLTFVAIPGEPTAAAGRELRKAVGDESAIIFGLCNGYVGYIETPDRVTKGIGETPRQYFDASLLERFTAAASLAGKSLGVSSATPGASPRSP